MNYGARVVALRSSSCIMGMESNAFESELAEVPRVVGQKVVGSAEPSIRDWEPLRYFFLDPIISLFQQMKGKDECIGRLYQRQL